MFLRENALVEQLVPYQGSPKSRFPSCILLRQRPTALSTLG